MPEIDDRQGLWIVFGGDPPDPGGAVAEDHLAWGLGEAAPVGLAAHALGEGGGVRVGIAAGSALDGGRIGHRAGIAGGAAGRVALLAVQTVTTLTSRIPAEPSGCLPARLLYCTFPCNA